MTDITAWAAATAEDGRRTGPEKLIAAHLLDFIRRGRMRIAELDAMEKRCAREIDETQVALDCAAHERARLEMMLQDLCQAIEPAAAPAVAKPGRTRKAKVIPSAPAEQQTNHGTAETLDIPADPKTDDALVIPAALDRRAAE